MATSLHSLLAEFREAATSTRDMGDRFERLVLAFLKNDPLYQDKFSNVWLWQEWPRRGNRVDTGIDLVAEERATGDFCAIQCKFYHPDHTLDKKDIDSFFTASGTKEFTSRIIVSTTDLWSKHAETALKNQLIPVTRLRVQDLADSPIDWSQFSLDRPQDVQLRAKKQLRPHQQTALTHVMAGLATNDRGKLIMACGTGKTFTALKIAEQFAGSSGQVLFLVPSISLLAQTLREWTAEAEVMLHNIAVCSDTKVGKKKIDTEDLHTYDLALPPTTNAQDIVNQAKKRPDTAQLTVIYSTYQSIAAIADAQTKGLPAFDLIICDEAHRTAGVSETGNESYFLKVHDQAYIQGQKRLYMTATPKLYADTAKSKALENDFFLCSMDDPELYGPELHRLGFSEAVAKGLLTDYKVMVLAVDEKYVSATFQRQLADANNELNLEDAVKITGCWNGLSKRMLRDIEGKTIDGDLTPMRRAVAFSRTIEESKLITRLFAEIVDEYRRTHPNEDILHCEVDHVDGTQNALERSSKLDWLKADTSDKGNVCRILSNARCLSEGVDVPSLDAVMFLTPRNSVVDVVQSVGRVMRKAEGKKYGYIILPIGIPADTSPEVALKDNEKYKVVWQVLQALRAHDDRFNAIVNKIELNQQKPPEVNVIGVGGKADTPDNTETVDSTKEPTIRQIQINFPQLEEWREAIYTKIVQKCGDRRYWEDWAGTVAKIAESHIARIQAVLERGTDEHKAAFDQFLQGLRVNINPTVSEAEAIEMLAQHLITKPVFDALFEGYAFTTQNPVSQSMQAILAVLEGQQLAKDTAKLDKFYASVRQRAEGIDNAQGKQKIVVELYDKFFRYAFPRLSDRLGIVYTPVEVVDFIINSVDHALRQEFGTGVTDAGVHILDPFTGTGTFMVRLLQSGLIKPEDLKRKFTQELHANEIVLLAYYIAAINIEETYHSLAGGEYQPFNGIVLTDTFQMFETEGTLEAEMFPENNQRVTDQKQQEIRVIIGNPPYSAGQTSENDGNKNLKYPQLDGRIAETYAEHSTATNKNSLYDSYIRAIRWASDRIGERGIVSYVTNGSFIDSNSADGLRKCLTDEFSSIYCFNLRGNGRTSGERCRKEGHPLFAAHGGKGGSLAPVSINVFIKNSTDKSKCNLYYHDIGDYLKREEKLKRIQDFGSISTIPWQTLSPNSNHDWINQRDPRFETFILLGDKKDANSKTIFDLYSSGLKTNRDGWCYNFSRERLTANMSRMIDFYNQQVEAYQAISGAKPSIDSFIDTDPHKINWSRGLKNDFEKQRKHRFEPSSLIRGIYRPYCKQWAYFNRSLNDMVYQMPKIFPKEGLDNLAICVTGIGAGKDFSGLVTNVIPNLHLHDTGQCFPLYTYEKQEVTDQLSMLQQSEGYTRKDNISNAILKEFQTTYTDPKITKEDIFYYIYGILHSPEYKQRFGDTLKKMLPRIPYAADFWAFSKAGRDLAHWHLNYETIEPYDLNEWKSELFLDDGDYRVEKMTFGNRNKDKTTIVYNSKVTLSGIPLGAYDYIVNGKSALDWIMERYQITKDKDSGIVNDPNNWSDDPRYILDLVKRIVRVSVETVKIVNALPPLNEQ